MTLDRISLETFRNHAATSLEGTGRFNLLVGENGAGKTNILEALSLLAPGRGLRRAALADMAGQDGAGGFGIGASLVPADASGPAAEPVRLGTFTQAAQPGRRHVRIDGSASSAVALGEWLSVGWLTPAMDRLFADSAGARRRYMDRLAVAIDPGHAAHAARFSAALRERNRLLSAERAPEAAWLDGIEAQLARHGALLTEGRARLVAGLTEALAEAPAEPFARPALSHRAGGPLGEKDLLTALHEERAKARRAGRTLTGPHRDELDVVFAAKNVAAAQCSTGEQKAMLIAMTLAHGRLAQQGRASILLLDEVAAHLDPLRRGALFERLAEGSAQIWMTGTEMAAFEAILPQASVWRIAEGRAIPV
ncbi:DNA replication/repair protein RecF [Altererythrobacter aurantiacus]|uniref:DNA replication and repair protein RecF n=1 Tax=Parapontixanthobacter aurantiacus TaxID=1463599 RepID=A0A844ZFN0_9SPHN|nr:DNA replication/repair protein RecF [Parapontixanthobacter aurantiacus]MXO85770.1 DNA replication/repair protein RecF [Parapontixanthobacter aurantiacus]